MIDELVNDYCILGDDGAVIFASYDHVLEFVEKIRADAVTMRPERVDETAKDRLVRIMGTFDLATGHADTMEQALDALEDELRDVLGHLRVRHEWVGFTDGEKKYLKALGYVGIDDIEERLKEKNT